MEVCEKEWWPTQLCDVSRTLALSKTDFCEKDVYEEIDNYRTSFSNPACLSGPTSVGCEKLQTHFSSSADEKSLKTEAVIQLFVSLSKNSWQ